MENIIEFINRAPKAELHLHIEGTLEPDLLLKLARRNGIKIPFKNIDEIKSAYNFTNLQSFLDIYYQGSKVLIHEKDFYDLTWAYAKKCKEENVVHTEIFFDPQTHTTRGINFDIVINGIYRALSDANKKFGLTFKIIMCFLRHLKEDSAFDILHQALDHKDKIIGVGLDSSEIGNPPSKFKNVFQKALKNNFLTVAHAGEEGPTEYIWDSLNLLKVKRIDHGVQCLHDDKLVKKLKDEKIPLTVCPLSNIKLKIFDEFKDHNLKQMLNEGLLISLNSDDPAYFGGYINKNYIESQKLLNLSLKDIKRLIANSFESSFLDKEKKEEWIRKI